MKFILQTQIFSDLLHIGVTRRWIRNSCGRTSSYATMWIWQGVWSSKSDAGFRPGDQLTFQCSKCWTNG